MESKKSEKADLEWRRPVFFEIGLCIALALVLTAFDVIGPREKEETITQQYDVEIEENDIQNTKREETPPPPPEPVKVNTNFVITDEKIALPDINVDNSFTEDDVFDRVDGPIDEPTEDDAQEEEIIAIVEKNAEFPGGPEALNKYLHDNLVYPRQANEAGLQGKVIVEFVVEKDGRLSNVKVKRSVAPILDDEAVRVVKSMPRWTPGKQHNVAVRSRFVLPINFQLTN